MTQQDIAKLAHVSRTTVSRVLNGDPTVNETLKKRILEVIEQTGYQKNYISSSLASKNIKNIYAFIVESIDSNYSKELIKGFEKIQEEKKEFGYKINIIKTPINAPEEQLFKLKEILESKKIEGIIITPLLRVEILKLLELYPKINVIALDAKLDENIPYIGANYTQSGEIAGDLINEILRKNEKILVLKFPDDYISSKKYYDGLILSIDQEKLITVETLKKIAFENSNFLEKLIIPEIKLITTNRYLKELILNNQGFLEKNKDIRIVGVGGNHDTNQYVENGLMAFSINECYSDIGYSLGKIFFEQVFKDKYIPICKFIKPKIITKSYLKK